MEKSVFVRSNHINLK